ncbi:MAG: SCO family protein [Bacillota bacterium]|nr:SCO family protein [Bacillota bacterium]
MADFFHQGLRFGRIKEWEHTKSVNWAVAFSSRQLCVVAFTCFLLAGGCRRTAPEAGQSASEAGAKHYPVRGKIVTVDPQHGEIVLDAAAIPGYMEAMTMPYKLKNPSILGELHPGDSITATLIATEDSDLLDQIVIIAQAKPDYKPSFFYHPIQPGDKVPDFKLLNQNGKQIHLAQFHGKVLLVTFIYTRCPLADYCPRMSRNFAEIDKALAKAPELYGKTHLLSVSFDPDYDTPKVLRSYGSAYTGNYTKETFAHWDFAAPSRNDLPAVLRYFDVGATPEKDRTITHSLSTLVIGPDGRVFKWYPTNDWTPDQILSDVKQLVAKQGKA